MKYLNHSKIKFYGLLYVLGYTESIWKADFFSRFIVLSGFAYICGLVKDLNFTAFIILTL